jgi:predicted nucleic acid-binding protein
MIRVVLDTSVFVKSIFKPLRSLSVEAYSRELDTHEKCKALMKHIEEQDIEVHVPKVCVVETAAAPGRLPVGLWPKEHQMKS